jgi:hypothetical protein
VHSFPSCASPCGLGLSSTVPTVGVLLSMVYFAHDAIAQESYRDASRFARRHSGSNRTVPLSVHQRVSTSNERFVAVGNTFDLQGCRSQVVYTQPSLAASGKQIFSRYGAAPWYNVYLRGWRSSRSPRKILYIRRPAQPLPPPPKFNNIRSPFRLCRLDLCYAGSSGPIPCTPK